MTQYDVPEYSDVTEFLTFLAKRNGKLKKGGLMDLDKAAKIVLQDWNRSAAIFATCICFSDLKSSTVISHWVMYNSYGFTSIYALC